MKKLATAATALALTMTLTACGTSSDPNDEDHINGMDRAMAFVLCKKNVEKKLQSPDSAKWQNITSATIEKSDDGNQWGVRTHVDSDNAMGASLRTEVACTVRPSSEDTAEVESALL